MRLPRTAVLLQALALLSGDPLTAGQIDQELQVVLHNAGFTGRIE